MYQCRQECVVSVMPGSSLGGQTQFSVMVYDCTKNQVERFFPPN